MVVKVALTVLETGDLVESSIYTDDSGNIVQVVPAAPLDPYTEYRLGPELR